MTDHLLVWGLVAHFIADWIFQNEWMAKNKVQLRHPAGWVHGLVHFLALALVFGPIVAALLAVVHVLIDTRKPRQWWRRVFQQTDDPSNPITMHVAIWTDQVMHMACVALAAWVRGH